MSVCTFPWEVFSTCTIWSNLKLWIFWLNWLYWTVIVMDRISVFFIFFILHCICADEESTFGGYRTLCNFLVRRIKAYYKCCKSHRNNHDLLTLLQKRGCCAINLLYKQFVELVLYQFEPPTDWAQTVWRSAMMRSLTDAVYWLFL